MPYTLPTAPRILALGALLLLSFALGRPATATAASTGPPRSTHAPGSPYTTEPANIPPPITYTDPALISLTGIWLGTITR